MSKEHGNSAGCVKNVAQENRDFFMVEGPDGKPKISALSGAFTNVPTPEQIKEMQKGGVAIDWAMLNKMSMLAIDGKADDDFDTQNRATMISLHQDMVLASGNSPKVKDMEKVAKIVNMAEVEATGHGMPQKIDSRMLKVQGGRPQGGRP